mmetsp:Transcript_147562/g.367827  ORF Transcript_147562/g.367827 Transcript_147562/m.367827 type:complete len:229 (+) Transcript_147562:92-778(+)
MPSSRRPPLTSPVRASVTLHNPPRQPRRRSEEAVAARLASPPSAARPLMNPELSSVLATMPSTGTIARATQRATPRATRAVAKLRAGSRKNIQRQGQCGGRSSATLATAGPSTVCSRGWTSQRRTASSKPGLSRSSRPPRSRIRAGNTQCATWRIQAPGPTSTRSGSSSGKAPRPSASGTCPTRPSRPSPGTSSSAPRRPPPPSTPASCGSATPPTAAARGPARRATT